MMKTVGLQPISLLLTYFYTLKDKIEESNRTKMDNYVVEIYTLLKNQLILTLL